MNVGIIGCGTISEVYLANLTTRFPQVKMTAVADLLPERAAQKAREHGIPRACSVEELLGDPDVELVVNLTVPAAHAEVTLAAIDAGKHVYTEKPLAISLRDGEKILTSARKKNVRVGAAPDTFLGPGIQACISLINDGVIGLPTAAAAFMTSHGPESWHPDPAFYYTQGGGPVFDMGPYYITALLAMLGPAQRVSGSVKRTFPRRLVESGPRAGEIIPVEVPTHAAGTVDFAIGTTVTFVMSFDVWHAGLPRMEIYGTDGSLSVPDPNTFGGPVRVRGSTDAEWHDVDVPAAFSGDCRGLGVAEMADAILNGRPHRASGAMALHALEIMHAVHDASDSQKYVTLRFPSPRPEPFSDQEVLRAVVE